MAAVFGNCPAIWEVSALNRRRRLYISTRRDFADADDLLSGRGATAFAKEGSMMFAETEQIDILLGSSRHKIPNRGTIEHFFHILMVPACKES
jgi:hypothetical protein